MSRAGQDRSGRYPDKVLHVILCRGPAPNFFHRGAKLRLSRGKSGVKPGLRLGNSGLSRGKS